MKKIVLLLFISVSLFSQYNYRHAYVDTINYYVIEIVGEQQYRVDKEAGLYKEYAQTHTIPKISGSKYVTIVNNNVVFDTSQYRIDTTQEGVIRDDNFYLDKLAKTDWLVVRHYEQVLNGDTPTLTQTKLNTLLARRKYWRSRIKQSLTDEVTQ